MRGDIAYLTDSTKTKTYKNTEVRYTRGGYTPVVNLGADRRATFSIRQPYYPLRFQNKFGCPLAAPQARVGTGRQGHQSPDPWGADEIPESKASLYVGPAGCRQRERFRCCYFNDPRGASNRSHPTRSSATSTREPTRLSLAQLLTSSGAREQAQVTTSTLSRCTNAGLGERAACSSGLPCRHQSPFPREYARDEGS